MILAVWQVNMHGVASVFIPPPPSVWPHLFCGAGHEKRRGEQLKWSLAFRLYIGSFVFHVHSYQDQFIQPGWAECVLFSLGLYYVFVLL